MSRNNRSKIRNFNIHAYLKSINDSNCIKLSTSLIQPIDIRSLKKDDFKEYCKRLLGKFDINDIALFHNIELSKFQIMLIKNNIQPFRDTFNKLKLEINYLTKTSSYNAIMNKLISFIERKDNQYSYILKYYNISPKDFEYIMKLFAININIYFGKTEYDDKVVLPDDYYGLFNYKMMGIPIKNQIYKTSSKLNSKVRDNEFSKFVSLSFNNKCKFIKKYIDDNINKKELFEKLDLNFDKTVESIKNRIDDLQIKYKSRHAKTLCDLFISFYNLDSDENIKRYSKIFEYNKNVLNSHEYTRREKYTKIRTYVLENINTDGDEFIENSFSNNDLSLKYKKSKIKTDFAIHYNITTKKYELVTENDIITNMLLFSNIDDNYSEFYNFIINELDTISNDNKENQEEQIEKSSIYSSNNIDNNTLEFDSTPRFINNIKNTDKESEYPNLVKMSCEFEIYDASCKNKLIGNIENLLEMVNNKCKIIVNIEKM